MRPFGSMHPDDVAVDLERRIKFSRPLSEIMLSGRDYGDTLMSALGAQRGSVTQDELNSSEDAAVEAAIRVHEWVQREVLSLAKAIRDPEHGPSAHREHQTESYAKEGVS